MQVRISPLSLAHFNKIDVHQQPIRAVGRSKNPEVPVLFGGHNLSPLVEIELTDLPKSGSAMAPPTPLETTNPGQTKS